MRVNWCRACGDGSNFGDQLSPVLLRHFGIRVTWATPEKAELVAVGSILSKFPNGWTGSVLGTGFIHEGLRKDLSQARVLAVRGALTRKACRLPATTPLGDLGLLVPDLIADRPEPDGMLLAPHVIDRSLRKRYPRARVIDLHRPPAEVVTAIAGAALVITSSLHAFIAADAFGIPVVLEPHGKVIGGLYKFQDFVSAMGAKLIVGKPYLSPRAAIGERQEELRKLVRTLA